MFFKEPTFTDKSKKRLISDFIRKHSHSNFWFMCNVALPIYFRLDWLYHLLANFKSEIYTKTGYQPQYFEIANILHSPFIYKIGFEIYEYDSEFREFMLYELEQEFGTDHIKKLSTFLYQYAVKCSPTKSEKDTHQITAYSILFPQLAVTSIAESFNNATDNETEQIRLHYLLETISAPLETEQREYFTPLKQITEDKILRVTFKTL